MEPIKVLSLSPPPHTLNHPYPEVHLRRRRRRSAVDRRRRVGLLRQLEQGPRRLPLRPRVAGGVRQQPQQHVEAAAVDKDRPQVVVARDEPGERRGDALARGPVPSAHREQHAGEHRRPGGLVLKALERLLDAVLRRLHQQLAVQEGLDGPLAD